MKGSAFISSKENKETLRSSVKKASGRFEGRTAVLPLEFCFEQVSLSRFIPSVRFNKKRKYMFKNIRGKHICNFPPKGFLDCYLRKRENMDFPKGTTLEKRPGCFKAIYSFLFHSGALTSVLFLKYPLGYSHIRFFSLTLYKKRQVFSSKNRSHSFTFTNILVCSL